LFIDKEQSSYWENIYISTIGLLVTGWVLNTLAAYRENQRLKEQLIYNISNSDRKTAVNAVNELRRRNWKNLKKRNFDKANLSKADFSTFNLSGSTFREANLFKTHFEGADLTEVDFLGANLYSAVFTFNPNITIKELITYHRAKTSEDLNQILKHELDTDLAGFFQGLKDNRWMAQFSTSTRLPDGKAYLSFEDLYYFTGGKYYGKLEKQPPPTGEEIRFYCVISASINPTPPLEDWEMLIQTIKQYDSEHGLGIERQGDYAHLKIVTRPSYVPGALLLRIALAPEHVDRILKNLKWRIMEYNLIRSSQVHINNDLLQLMDIEDVRAATRFAAYFRHLFLKAADEKLLRPPIWTPEYFELFSTGLSIEVVGYGDRQLAIGQASKYLTQNTHIWEPPDENE
jgi:hypothetical protein